jgi:hypothetical protein
MLRNGLDGCAKDFQISARGRMEPGRDHVVGWQFSTSTSRRLMTPGGSMSGDLRI